MQRNYIVRNYRPQDFSAYVRLNMNFSKSDAVKRTDSLEALSQMLNKPGYRAVDDLFIAEADGAIVGCANVTPELGIGRVIIDYLVHPAYCTGSMPGELINCSLERAKHLGAKVAHMNISSEELSTIVLLANLGFYEVRCFHELRLDLSKVDLENNGQSTSGYRHLESGEEEKLAEIQDRCFSGTWGYDSEAARHIMWWLNFRRSCLDDVIFAVDDAKILGYCWAGTSCGCDLSTGKSKGRIYMMGVDPKYRSKGIGRKLLLAGLLYLKSKGREIIDITVDSQNIEAVALYRSVGFKLSENTLWYEKVID